jgi:hypothetical protein
VNCGISLGLSRTLEAMKSDAIQLLNLKVIICSMLPVGCCGNSRGGQ